NYTSSLLGRSFKQYEKGFEKLCLADQVNRLTRETLSELSLPSDRSLNTMEPAVEAQVLQMVEEKTRQAMDLQAPLLLHAGIEKYDQLVDNQPQFHLTAKKTFRDPLVGSDELSVKVTYEWGLENLNKVKNFKDSSCKKSGWTNPSCYTEYVAKNALKINQGHRFSFSGEYVEGDGETIDTGFSDLGPLVSEDASTLVLSLGWGRKLKGGTEPIQFDLEGSYEDVSDDPQRQDRGIVRLTFTRKVGEMSIPFGIVYANHGKFLDDEDFDARLSAHIGLKFNMSGMNDDQ
ncbi:MAG TPA: hypothetical protein VF179_13295, partial [Thermoanaerobaculia bacterium]|nr:hypothetical protein [Thermoanaerobaculia bacterium]